MSRLNFTARQRHGLRSSLRAWLDATWGYFMVSDRTEAPRFASAILLVFMSVLLGGASATNALAQAAVELASLPLLFLSLYRLLRAGAPAGSGLPLILLAFTVGIPILQLAPLPAAIWTTLPERAAGLAVLNAAHVGPIALPLTLAPEGTWRGLLALLPPAAMFLGTLQLHENRRRVMIGCWLSLAALSMIVGVLQVLSGPNGPFYLYEITNLRSPVGLFANRNHQAAFLLCLIPLAALVATRLKDGWTDRSAFVGTLAALYLPLALAGVAATLSRAGILLAGVALLSAVAITLRAGLWRRHWREALGVSVVGGGSVAAVLIFGLAPIVERFGQPDDLRLEAWPVILQAANGYLPLGSGIGSFDTVYRSVESLDQVGPVYLNHAHNDLLELWLETGLAGAIVLAVFLAWLVRRSIEIWRSRGGGELAAGSSLLVLLLFAHSAVDYPLRTESLVVLFAFACANVVGASKASSARQPHTSEAGPHLKAGDA